VNGPEPLIADALREIEAEAPAPRRMADAAWQAGRRRRRRGLAAAVTAGAGAVAAVIVLILAVAGSPGPSSGPPTLAPGTVTLSTPIQFRQVASISGHACLGRPTSRWARIRRARTPVTGSPARG